MGVLANGQDVRDGYFACEISWGGAYTAAESAKSAADSITDSLLSLLPSLSLLSIKGHGRGSRRGHDTVELLVRCNWYIHYAYFREDLAHCSRSSAPTSR